MKKVLLSLTAAAAFVFAAGTVNAQVNGPITGKTQVVQANANLQAEIKVTIPTPGADGGAVRFGTVPTNSAINMDPRAVASTNLGLPPVPATGVSTALPPVSGGPGTIAPPLPNVGSLPPLPPPSTGLNGLPPVDPGPGSAPTTAAGEYKVQKGDIGTLTPAIGVQLIQNQELETFHILDDLPVEFVLPCHEQFEHYEVGQDDVGRGIGSSPALLILVLTGVSRKGWL
jgi:hypothetical protein